MDTSDRTNTKSCMCPLCAVYKANVANVQRWASERYQKRKAKHDEKLQRQRDYHEMILQKLRDKHALQIKAFDELVQAEATADATTTADMEMQYKDELQSMNSNLKQTVSEMVTRFKQDYADRTGKLEGFCVPADSELLPATWDALYDDESARESADREGAPSPDSGEDVRVELVVDENAQLKVVCEKATMQD